MARFDVLGEDEHAEVRVGLLDLVRGLRALVGEGRRHPDVEDDEVGIVLGDRRQQPACVAERSDDLVSAVLEQTPETLAKQHLVLGDHDTHGSSAVSVVPAPGALSIRRVPPRAAIAVGEPSQARPLPDDRASDAVVGDGDDELPVSPRRR